MKKNVLLLLIWLITGCQDPNDIVLGAEPVKQIADQGEIFKKLPEEDRKILIGYLTMNEMGKAFGNNSLSVTGMTVKEAIVKAKAWKKTLEENEAASKALKEKAISERKVIADKIASSITLAVTDKKILPINYEIQRFEPLLTFTYAIENKTNREIKQLKGSLSFKDAVGDVIGTLHFDCDESIKASKTLTTTTGTGWKINQFMNGDIEKIASKEFEAMHVEFIPESIAFQDGEVIKSPDLL